MCHCTCPQGASTSNTFALPLTLSVCTKHALSQLRPFLNEVVLGVVWGKSPSLQYGGGDCTREGWGRCISKLMCGCNIVHS